MIVHRTQLYPLKSVYRSAWLTARRVPGGWRWHPPAQTQPHRKGAATAHDALYTTTLHEAARELAMK